MIPAGKKIRAAVVGCGRISPYHVDALKAMPDVEVVAACDLNEQLAAGLATQKGIPHVFTDMETMMQEGRPDVVHLITPPHNHVRLAETAAKYQAHMYIEKPFATSTADAERILAAAKAAGVQVCAGHSRLFDPLFRTACRRIEAGEIGRVLSVRAELGFTYDSSARSAMIPWDYKYDWGIFENFIPHPLSLVCYFLREPGRPHAVGLNAGRVREAAVEEFRVVIPSANAIGEVSLSLAAAPEVNRFEVIGTSGRVALDFNAFTMVSSRENGLPAFVNRFAGNYLTALRLVGTSSAVALRVATGGITRYMGIRALIAEFYRALREGSPSPVRPEAALVNVRLMEQIRDACRNLAKPRIEKNAARAVRPVARIVVTGASGFLGGRLVERLSSEGVAVRATTRLISRATQLPNVDWVECDMMHAEDVRRALQGVETVFHCAALVGAPGSPEEYRAANVESTVRLMQLAGQAGIKTFVYVSSLCVYGIPRTGARVVNEDAGYDPRAGQRGVYTQTKLQADKAVLDYAAEHATPRVVVLRPGTIYGPGTQLPLGLFQLPSTARWPLVTGGGRVPMALTYVDNVVDAMLAVANADICTGTAYNIVDSTEVDQRQLVDSVRRLSGGRIHPVMVPYCAVWSMMLLVDVLSFLRHSRAGTARVRLKRTMASLRFPCTAARTQLGWQPRISLMEGLSRVLDSRAASAVLPVPVQMEHAVVAPGELIPEAGSR